MTEVWGVRLREISADSELPTMRGHAFWHSRRREGWGKEANRAEDEWDREGNGEAAEEVREKKERELCRESFGGRKGEG